MTGRRYRDQHGELMGDLPLMTPRKMASRRRRLISCIVIEVEGLTAAMAIALAASTFGPFLGGAIGVFFAYLFSYAAVAAAIDIWLGPPR